MTVSESTAVAVAFALVVAVVADSVAVFIGEVTTRCAGFPCFEIVADPVAIGIGESLLVFIFADGRFVGGYRYVGLRKALQGKECQDQKGQEKF